MVPGSQHDLRCRPPPLVLRSSWARQSQTPTPSSLQHQPEREGGGGRAATRRCCLPFGPPRTTAAHRLALGNALLGLDSAPEGRRQRLHAHSGGSGDGGEAPPRADYAEGNRWRAFPRRCILAVRPTSQAERRRTFRLFSFRPDPLPASHSRALNGNWANAELPVSSGAAQRMRANSVSHATVFATAPYRLCERGCGIVGRGGVTSACGRSG